MCLRVALPTQTGGRSVSGRGECWSAWASFLAPLLEYDLISGQAVPCRPQWGMAWDRKRRNEGPCGARVHQPFQYDGTNMVDRKDTFQCYINSVLSLSLRHAAMKEKQSVP